MDLHHISHSDWEHLRTNYRDAYAFLLHASLIGEWSHLIEKNNLNDWEANRLTELNNRFLVKK
jgi:hypothetical protein